MSDPDPDPVQDPARARFRQVFAQVDERSRDRPGTDPAALVAAVASLIIVLLGPLLAALLLPRPTSGRALALLLTGILAAVVGAAGVARSDDRGDPAAMLAVLGITFGGIEIVVATVALAG
ncbi:MAG TPA: hypothetical protein VIB62_04095 [Actinomycetota bacterium]|jgi:hypothetical protein